MDSTKRSANAFRFGLLAGRITGVTPPSRSTATQLGFNPVLTASVNSAAGGMGKMISVASIAVACAATGLTSEGEGQLFRFTCKHSLFLACLVGVVAMLCAYVVPGLVPVLPPT